MHAAYGVAAAEAHASLMPFSALQRTAALQQVISRALAPEEQRTEQPSSDAAPPKCVH
jgi:hypothetical protein